MENETEVDVTTHTSEEQEVVESPVEDIEMLKAKLAVVEEERERERTAKNAILARAKLAESKLKSSAPITNESPRRNDQIIDLRLDGYSAEEAAFVIANGGRKALEDKTSLVSLAVQAKRDQRTSEQAASQTSQGSSQLPEVERRFTPEQLNNMTVKELEKILPRA